MVDQIEQFRSSGCGTRIQVNNVPAKVSREALYHLFSAEGEVMDVHEQLSPSSAGDFKQLMVTFREAEAARCVLATMDGFSLGGSRIRLRPSPSSSSNGLPALSYSNSRPTTSRNQHPDKGGKLPIPIARPASKHSERSSDFLPRNHTALAPPQDKPRAAFKAEGGVPAGQKHCNLYILNLSLDMTNETLKAIIQKIGEVKHVCVLATLDNAGRRRAFVDMATPAEACRVIESFHGKKVEGYELHISYAFIQRSGGPTMSFDGITTLKATDQRRSSNQDLSNKPITNCSSEDRQKYYSTRKSISFPSSRNNQVTKVSKINLNRSSQLNSSPRSPLQPISPLGSSGGTPEFDSTSGFPLTPLSSCGNKWGADISNSTLFETSFLKDSNSREDLASAKSRPEWTLLVTNLSPVACIDSDDLYRFFIREGLTNLKSAFLNVDGNNGMSLGYGTLTFDSLEEYRKALETIYSKNITLGGAKVMCSKLDANNISNFPNHPAGELNPMLSDFTEFYHH